MSTSAWPQENWARLGEAIAKARRSKGWDQAALAMRSGNSPNTISNYERGRATRSRRVPTGLHRVAQALGWPPDAVSQILDGGDPKRVLGQVTLDVAAGGAEVGGSVGGPVAPPRLMDTRDMELASSGYLAQDTFIRQMKRYRKMRGISPEEVVSRIADLGGDLSVQDLTRLEDGTRLLAMAEAQFLAAALDTSVEWLLGSAFQSDAPEELTAPPTDEELQVEAKAVERRIFEIGTQLNHAVMQRAQAVKRAEMARREADMAILLQQQVFTQKAELERQYHYLLGRIDSLRAAKGEEQMLQTHLAEEDEADETPGKLLQHARRRNLMTYEEIESLTRIRPEVIKEIERNNFAALGAGSEHQDAYVRECIRALANAYGIPSEPLIEDYDEFYANKQLPAHLREWRDLEERTGRKHRPRLRGRGFVTEEREGSVPPEKQ